MSLIEVVITPTCDNCGDKFPGDPCKTCGKPKHVARGDWTKLIKRTILVRTNAISPTDRARKRAYARSISAKPRKRGHGRNR